MDNTVYQLKATILDVKPPVWRRIVVPAEITLSRLHDVLRAAFGWWDYHLHEFEIDGLRYGIDDGEGWEPPEDERRSPVECGRRGRARRSSTSTTSVTTGGTRSSSKR